jgi:hypothetical protein
MHVLSRYCMNKYQRTVCLSLILLSCSKDEVKPVPVKYFEVQIDPSYNTASSDNWIILHNKDGNLLSVKHFEAGDNLIFDSTVTISGKIGVTIASFNVNLPPNYNEYEFQSFLGEEVNAKWTLKNMVPDFPLEETSGELFVDIVDPQIGSPYDAQISSPHWSATPLSTEEGHLTFGFYKSATTKDFFISIVDKDDNPHYIFLHDPSASASFSLSDFSDYDKIVHVNFAPSATSYVLVRAYERAEPYSAYTGYLTDAFFSGFGVEKSSYKIGYLDGFENYYTGMYAGYEGYGFGYESFGPAPTADIALENQINITLSNKTFYNFALSSTDYSWRSSSWGQSGILNGELVSTYWVVKSGAEPFANLKIVPRFIYDRYPEYSLSKMAHHTTQLYQGTSFEDHISQRFKGAGVGPYIQISKQLF